MNSCYFICPKCKGQKDITIEFEYEGKTYEYYQTCERCRGKGKLDWVDFARGKRTNLFCDFHPAGSLCIDGTKDQLLGGSYVYDGRKYVSVKTERGKALWFHLVQPEDE